MSLTLPTAYSNSSKLGNIQENWIVQLGFFNGDAQGSGEGGWDAVLQTGGTANETKVAVTDAAATSVDVDDSSVFTDGDYIKIDTEILKVNGAPPDSDTINVTRGEMSTTAATHLINKQIYWNNFTPISLADTTIDDVFYHGTITNKPSIRSSIDLANSTAKTGNISLSVINWKFKNDDFSAELFLGTRKYINRDVKIYSQLNGDTTLANCLQIYQGRLIDISHDDSKISLKLTEQRPWDFITIPQDQSTTQVYVPVVYGDYTRNPDGSLAGASASFCDSKALFPCPNLNFGIVEYTSQDEHVYFCYPQSETSKAEPHFYDSNVDKFIQFTGVGSPTNTTTRTKVGVHSVGVHIDMERGFFLIRPVSPVGTVSGSGSQSWANEAYSVNGNTGNGATGSCNPDASNDGSTNNAYATLDFDIPTVDGELSGNYYLFIKGSVGHVETSGTTSTSLKVGNTIVATADTSTSGTPVTTTGYTVKGVSGYSRVNIAAESTVNIRVQTVVHGVSVGSPGVGSGSGTINDIVIQQKCKNDITNERTASLDKLSKLDNVYCGADGYANTFTGGSGTAATGLAAHRDLLFRFTGFDDTDANIYNYDANLDIEDKRIDSAADEDNWNIRWWALKPIELKKILEQIQYEFCFIFKWRNDGSGSYWFIKDSYSSSEATLKSSDISNLQINNTPFSELITDMRINYEKHPAEDKYLSSQTSKDTTNNPRTTWNIQSKENIKEVNLDMNVNKPGNTNVGGNDPNDGFADYYMNIFGDIKKIISCDIVNPAVSYNLETGDIIQFSNTAGDMPVEPFGDNWADYYMIINLVRGLGTVKITAREVG